MDTELAYSILEIMQTMEDAAKEMKLKYIAGDIQGFNSLSMDLWDGISAVRDVARQNVPNGSRIRLVDACSCALESLKDIKLLVITNPEKVEWKLEYELIPLIESGAMQFYYWAIVDGHPEKEEEYQAFLKNTDIFGLLRIPVEQRKYEVDLTIAITGYNHLDYTMQCVESVLSNLPKNIKTEIILLNHGSKDGTKEYFEKMKEVKVINVAVNGAAPGVNLKAISHGKYFLNISNDIVVGDNAIWNLYRCVKEHCDYGYVVPTTPAVSNLQTIEACYSTTDELKAFTKKNNIYDERRHEQRTRLCNPLCIFPTNIVVQLSLEMYEDKCCGKSVMSFPDDKNSLWMRRNGYKCILAKDAYCHHFGSVTLKHDLEKQEEQRHFYLEGRIDFMNRYGVDPWGTGFCYDYNLFQNWNIPGIDGANILGINCGLGSNSLKIKEVMREKGAINVTLYNGTQEKRFLEDLKGVSDKAFVFTKLTEIKDKTGRDYFDYIIIDEALENIEVKDIEQQVRKAELQFKELVYQVSDHEWTVIEY